MHGNPGCVYIRARMGAREVVPFDRPLIVNWDLRRVGLRLQCIDTRRIGDICSDESAPNHGPDGQVYYHHHQVNQRVVLHVGLCL